MITPRPSCRRNPEQELAEINDRLRAELLAWKPKRRRIDYLLLATSAVAFGSIIYIASLLLGL